MREKCAGEKAKGWKPLANSVDERSRDVTTVNGNNCVPSYPFHALKVTNPLLPCVIGGQA